MSEENVNKAIWTIWGAISLAYATHQYEAPIKELYDSVVGLGAAEREYWPHIQKEARRIWREMKKEKAAP